ncbi:MAG: hypothetical protein ACU85V_08935 [Gammaproteobacteria bacterium]
MHRLILALLLALAAALPASALPVSVPFLAAGAADAGAAARQAADMTGGRVLDVQAELSEGREVYLVKVLLEDGRVKVVRIEGTAGPDEP